MNKRIIKFSSYIWVKSLILGVFQNLEYQIFLQPRWRVKVKLFVKIVLKYYCLYPSFVLLKALKCPEMSIFFVFKIVWPPCYVIFNTGGERLRITRWASWRRSFPKRRSVVPSVSSCGHQFPTGGWHCRRGWYCKGGSHCKSCQNNATWKQKLPKVWFNGFFWQMFFRPQIFSL